MTERQYASTAQVAAALGVSITTVKRWVDEGVLRAERTVGGHRRILVAEVLRVARAGDSPLLDLGRLGLPRRGESSAEPKELAAQLLAALKQGDGSQARLLVQGYRNGLTVADLADSVVSPVMAQIGHQWQEGSLDVLHEHRASQACAAALYALKSDLEQSVKTGMPVAVGGGPEGDPYLLANLLVESVLLDAGWQAINFGPHTPIASFRKALKEFRPRLLWLSISHLESPDDFSREYRDLYRDAEHSGTAVALGGRALTEEVRTGLPYTTYGDRMSHLSAFAHSLHPVTRRPPRKK